MNRTSGFILTFVIGLLLLAGSCGDNSNFPPVQTPSIDKEDLWMVDHLGFLRNAGLGKDGIPTIDFPEFIAQDEATFLDEDDLVIVSKIGGIIRAYPHAILDWHEIVNDAVPGREFAIIYSPLTGTGVSWNRFNNGKSTTFGVSGLLYNSNIIPYDRTTDSNWSQMLGKSVNGVLTGSVPEVIHSVEMTWQTCRDLFPNVQVLSLNTGFDRDYDQYPYLSISGDYRVDPFLILSVYNEDNRKSNKERVFGLIQDGKAKIFDFQVFEEGPSIINDVVGNEHFVILGDAEKNYITAFASDSPRLNKLVFTTCECNPGIMTDQLDNVYNILGEVIEGPDLGYRLPAVNGFVGYWFAWAAIYPDLELYE